MADGYKPANMKKLHMESFEAAVSIIGSEPEKWRPTSRETADHSMGFMTVAALIDGKLDRDSFSPKKFKGKKYLDMLDRTKITEAKDLNKGYPDGIPNRLILTMNDGKEYSKTVKYPRGHAGNPMTDDEVEHKFRTLADGVISKRTQDQLLDSMWNLDKAKSVADVWKFRVS